jgi:glucose/mannose transport system substrate-binding protein
MLTAKLAGAGMALAIAGAPFSANALELTLFHTWSNESEMAALNSIIDAYTAKTGNTIKTASVPHETAGESPLTSLFIAGTPPNLFIAADAGFYRDLMSKGQGQPVDDLMAKIGATPEFP